MSLKDLFGKTTEKIVSNKQLEELYEQAESKYYLEEVVKDRERYLPAVDFSTSSNFIRYGSAEKYYTDSIKNIYQRYPYDGSKKEKLQWRNDSSQLDLYIFDNIYPKTTGYVNLLSGAILPINTASVNYRTANNATFIALSGGPNAGPDNKFETGNIFDLTKNRESNLGITEYGNTVEFWFKDNLSSGSVYTDYTYCLFDLWNGTLSGSSNYTRFTIARNANSFLISYVSGNLGVVEYPLNYTLDKNNWHHYAFTVGNDEILTSSLEICLYVDGDLKQRNLVDNYGILKLANNLDNTATIGTYNTNISGSESVIWKNIGVSYGSYDEFRFWKEKRTSQEISRNWFTSIGGGSNNDDSNTELGIYYKFNEGIIDTNNINSLDAICLDYSGRTSNGYVYNYNLQVRSTGSAIDIYNLKTIEQKDPIIYSSNPLVVNVLEEYAQSGSLYDNNNNSSIYKSLPTWITEEAEEKNLPDLSNLVQIIASYFDTLQLQIENLPRIKQLKYFNNNDKPTPFINKILSSNGFDNLEIFTNTTFLEEVLSRNEDQEFEVKIDQIKNTIYQNIYNNLVYIYKSKGTEKSFRNLIRCFGVDDELIKVNLYANNSLYDLENKYKATTTQKKYIDFNNTSSYSATIYQSSSADTRGFISSSLITGAFGEKIIYNIPITSQVEILFPKKIGYDSPLFVTPNFSKVSLFGVHSAPKGDNDTDWSSDNFNYQVFANKRNNLSNDVYFQLTGSFAGYGFNITSSYYNEVYDNEKWNLSVRVYPNKLHNAYTVSGSDVTDYTIELVGNNFSLDDSINDTFIISASIPQSYAKVALEENKRLYAGAHYQNFTGSILEKTDVKISSIRFWLDYLSNEELVHHSKDANSYGRQYPNQKPKFLKETATYINSLTSFVDEITNISTLALNWDFNNLSSSNSNGLFFITDISSGSIYPNNIVGYNWFSSMANYNHSGVGYNFPASFSDVISKEYIYSAKLQNPEVLNSTNLIDIPDTDDVLRSRKNRAVTYYIAFEKSMSQVINDEILNWFATLKEFNNAIGNPIEKYKKEYSQLNTIKKIFFEKVKNTPDFEKFIEFYKWIDSSISMMISQLVPASSNTSDKIRNILESHILERNKYENKLPTIEFKKIDSAKIFSAGNATIDPYLNSYSPYNPTGSIWLKKRANRTLSPVNTPGEPQNDIDREIIRQVINSNNLYDAPTLLNKETGETYESKKDFIRFYSKTYKLQAGNLPVISTIIKPNSFENKALITVKQFNTSSVNDSIFNQSASFGNYIRPYEYIQISGRSANNKAFVDLQGAVSGSTGSSGVSSGFIHRTLPVRNVNKQIFVQRFSAPGGPEVNSRGALDQESEEYSAYNNLNYRNYRVRENLKTWLAETASYSNENPSYHKVTRNSARFPENTAGTVTNTQNDNEFIVHSIPRSDTQYSWITSSLSDTLPYSTMFFADYSNILSYVSSSILSGTVSGSMAAGFTIIDYLSLLLSGSYTYNTSSNTTSIASGIHLNTYLLNLNGPYGYSTWKQIRNSNKKISVLSRKNNYILSQPQPALQTRTVDNVVETFIERRSQIVNSFKEPPVTFNKPMEHYVNVTGSKDTIVVASSYDNNKLYFANYDLMRNLKLSHKTDPQLHDLLFIADTKGVYTPSPEYIGAKYSMQVYPAHIYTGLADIRTKPSYEETSGTGSNGYDRNLARIRSFWRDSLNDRRRSNAYQTGTGTGSINSLDIPLISASIGSTNAQYIAHFVSSTFLSNVSVLSPITYSISSSLNNDSIKAIDGYTNKTFAIVGNKTFYPTVPVSTITQVNNQFRFNFNSSIVGELNGFNEFEARNMLAMPSGTYSTSSIIDITSFGGAAANTILTKFTYDYKYYQVLPRPSLIYNNHFPSLYAHHAAANIGGTIPNGIQAFVANYAFILNNGIKYLTDIISGKKPFYDSYEDFSNDIKPISGKYSILPEYNISTLMDYYIKTNNGDFSSLVTSSYLSLHGTNKNFDDITLETTYNKTNSLKDFLFDDFRKNKSADIKAKAIKKININVDGIKKLLPYKGFYPSERSLQVVDLFQKSFFNLSINDITGAYAVGASTTILSGSPLFQQMQTVLQPLFAPGILYNTIKSSIAVDWPVYLTGALNAYSSSKNNYPLPIYGGYIPIDNPENHYYTLFNLNKRLPFETLLNIKSAFSDDEISTASLLYLDPTRQSADAFYGNDRKNLRSPSYELSNQYRDFNKELEFTDDRYKLGINNYLGEIPKFFLKDEKLTTFNSAPQKDFYFESGYTYVMYLTLEKENNFKSLLDVGFEQTFVFGFKPASIITIANSYGSTVTFTDASSRVNYTGRIPAASYYGPPCNLYTSAGENATTLVGNNINGSNVTGIYQDPAYAPYVPPYYYGNTTLKLSFTPPSGSRNYYIKEIFDNLLLTDFSKDKEQLFISSSGFLNNSLTTDVLISTAYINRMPMTASLNIKNITNFKNISYDENGNIIQAADTTDNSLDVWSIQTKFETPILNFNDSLHRSYATISRFSSATDNNQYGYSSSYQLFEGNTIGIWSGYVSSSSNNGLTLKLYGAQEKGRIKNLADAVGFTNNNQVRVNKIGQLAEKKTISEAIVLIPYTASPKLNIDQIKKKYVKLLGENNIFDSSNLDYRTGPYYFRVNKTVINELLRINFDSQTREQIAKKIENLFTLGGYIEDVDVTVSNTSTLNDSNNTRTNTTTTETETIKIKKPISESSIIKTIKGMTEYIIPPHLDWVTNKNIDPFVMYLLEFKHELSKQDLSDIWQGVLPRIGTNAELDTATLSHELNKYEFFHDAGNVKNVLELPPDIRWKVFKVKKRANDSYYKLTSDSSDDNTFKFTFKNGITKPDYSYNWPYDFFSLVELVNISVDLEIEEKLKSKR